MKSANAVSSSIFQTLPSLASDRRAKHSPRRRIKEARKEKRGLPWHTQQRCRQASAATRRSQSAQNVVKLGGQHEQLPPRGAQAGQPWAQDAATRAASRSWAGWASNRPRSAEWEPAQTRTPDCLRTRIRGVPTTGEAAAVGPLRPSKRQCEHGLAALLVPQCRDHGRWQRGRSSVARDARSRWSWPREHGPKASGAEAPPGCAMSAAYTAAASGSVAEVPLRAGRSRRRARVAADGDGMVTGDAAQRALLTRPPQAAAAQEPLLWPGRASRRAPPSTAASAWPMGAAPRALPARRPQAAAAREPPPRGRSEQGGGRCRRRQQHGQGKQRGERCRRDRRKRQPPPPVAGAGREANSSGTAKGGAR
jgi:hypothetical protein